MSDYRSIRVMIAMARFLLISLAAWGWLVVVLALVDWDGFIAWMGWSSGLGRGYAGRLGTFYCARTALDLHYIPGDHGMQRAAIF